MNKKKVVFITLILLLFVAIILSLTIGSYKMTFSDVINTILGNGSKVQNITLLNIRIPRMLVAICVGVALSTAGCLLQTITKNDLAEPGIIGINAGAASAAIIFISYQTKDYYKELGEGAIYVLPLMAVLGAFISAIIIYALSIKKNTINPTRLLLVGIAINAGFNAFITFFTFRSGVGEYNRVLTWISGSLWGSGWSYAKIIIPIVLILFVAILLNHKKLDVLGLSDENIVSLGLNLRRERKRFLSLAVILAGSATAFAGNIAFLGLVSPHIARKLVGPYYKSLLVTSGLISVVIILLADVVSKNMFSPIEIPIGIIISIFGVPYFIYLMMKEK